MSTTSPPARPTLAARIQARGFRLTTSLSLLIVFIAMCVVFSILSPYFLTVENFVNIARTMPIVGIVAIGETLVLIAGGVDLSVGSVAALSGVVTGLLWEKAGLPIGIAATVGLLSGALVGLVNGLLVTRL
ncbi:MAG: ABC transporter permease, partial [Caldilineales bacterium]|nr:ABC transporter permease [Caldilineales bacterium]